MYENQITQWSSKFKKFGINDPFLQLITIKYEKLIEWQVKVNDEETFSKFIREVMLPELLKKITWDPNAEKSSKSFFMHYSSINPDAAIGNEALSPDETQVVKEHLKKIAKYNVLFENGEVNCSFNEFKRECRKSAAQYITAIFNERKEKSYASWVKLLKTNFKNHPGFQYLILKPLIEQSGYNSRRAVTAPDKAILNWLFVRIENRFYKPSVNLMQEYRFRLMNGLKVNVSHGWQYIPNKSSSVSVLTAASYGSGWCVASSDMARYYLESGNSFYILKKFSKPVVAIRVKNITERGILEIRGVSNSNPIDYYSDIWFFVKKIFREFDTSDLSKRPYFADLLPDFCKLTLAHMDQNKLNVSWWQDKLDLWPCTYDFIPEAIKPKCQFNKEIYLSNSFYLSLGNKVLSPYGIKFSETDYMDLLVHFPQLYNIIQDKDNKNYKDACITGYLNRLKFDDITFQEFKEMPAFIRDSNQINQQLQIKIPKTLIDAFTKRGTTYTSRLAGPQLAKLVSYTESEDIELTVIRALEYIIKNESSDFSDIIFPNEIRLHPQFSLIREQAWLKAVHKNPTFYFAFPVDLIQKNIWTPQSQIDEKHTALLEKWVSEVESRPWYLEAEKKIPKSVRYHEAMLQAYLRGWIYNLKITPYCMWKKINRYNRMYMSYAAFRNIYIFKTLATSYFFNERYIGHKKASARMFGIPTFQLAVIYASKYFNLPKYGIDKYIVALHPATSKPEEADPQRSLITLCKKWPLEKFNMFIHNTDHPDNYYFNRMEPNWPHKPIVKFGSRVELFMHKKKHLCSIGVEYPGYELIDQDSPEGKLIVGKFQGEKIKELDIRILRVI